MKNIELYFDEKNATRKDKLLIESFQFDAKRLNRLIDEYNGLPKGNDEAYRSRQNKLMSLFSELSLIKDKYAKEEGSVAKEVMARLTRCHSDALERGKKYGVSDLSDRLTKRAPKRPEIASKLETMPENQLKPIVGSLWNKNRLSIEGVTSHLAKEKQLETFLSQHSLEFLGGGNSRNYKVSQAGSRPYVLRVEDRMGSPKFAEQHLRTHSLGQSRFLEVMSDRSCDGSNIMVNAFSPGSDLLTYSMTRASDDARVESSIVLFDDMLDVLLKIQEENCLFPDMKNANWLVDDKLKLQIGDTKSLIYFDGGVKNSQPLFSTASIVVPEQDDLIKNKPVSADKLHAHIFGKNLYQYLTACDPRSMVDKHDASKLDFSHQVFHSKKGKALEELIRKLVIKDPKDRCSLAEAKVSMQSIKCEASPAKTPEAVHCQNLKEKLRTLAEERKAVGKTQRHDKVPLNNTNRPKV